MAITEDGGIQPAKKSKLRRDRKFNSSTGIQSQIPTAELPASRTVPRRSAEADHGAFVDVRGRRDPLELRDAAGQILCGDSAATLSLLPEASVACAVTSPPYWNMVDYGYDGQIGGTTYEQYRSDLVKVWQGLARVLRPNGKFALNVPIMPIRKEVSEKHFGKTHTRMLLDLYSDLKQDILQHTDLVLYSVYIWEKQTTEKMFGSYPYPPNLYERNYVEFIPVFVKPGPPPKLLPSVKEKARLTQEEWLELTKQIWWMYPENVGRAEGHPAPFPEVLPNRFISMYSFPSSKDDNFDGDIVLDPFNGWGTTCVAAKRLGRRFIGIDLSPDFCEYASTRLISVTANGKILKAERPNRRKAVGSTPA